MPKESSHKEILTKETIWYNIIFYGLLPLFAVANIQGARNVNHSDLSHS